MATGTAPPLPLTIAHFDNKHDNRPRCEQTDWAGLVQLLSRHTARATKDGPLVSPAAYPEGATRANAHVLEVAALSFDVDGTEPDWALLDGVAFVAYTTYSHRLVCEHNPTGAPCWRLVLQLDWPVEGADWERVWRRARARYAPTSDPSCSDASRMYYLPSHPPGATPAVRIGDGAPVDPESLPEAPEEVQERELAAARADAPPPSARPAGEERPGDRFNRESTWASVLEPHGWRSPGERGGCEVWNRPGRTGDRDARSANTTPDGNLYVWTSGAPPFEARRSYTKLQAHILLEHAGDWRAGIRALAARYDPPPVIDLGPERTNGHPSPPAADPDAPATTLADVVAVFQKWLYLDDLGPVYAVLAAVAANRMAGDPVWLMLVGASSGGKTEVINAITKERDVHPAATLTEAALLSGTPKRDKAAGAKGGLLRQIGDFGILVCKDFTSVLSMNRDPRAMLLAALREIFDGSWTRHIGVDGGVTLAWQGKVGLIAGCTAAIDSYHQVVATMGERFLLYRLPPIDAREQARRALRNTGRERLMRDALAGAVSGLFASLAPLPAAPPELEDAETDRLVALASLAARSRSGVERDSRTREIELIHDPEAPARIAQTLRRLYGGLLVIGLDRRTAWRCIAKIGLDCMPKLRRGVFDALAALEPDIWLGTSALAAHVAYPTITARRGLEDLMVHGVVERQEEPRGGSHLWRLTRWAREQFCLAGGVSEMSVSPNGGEG